MNTALDDRMRIALAELLVSQRGIMDGITELTNQGYLIEAGALNTALASLVTATNAAIAAVAAMPAVPA